VKVRELIDALSQLDPEARVVVEGFEGFGYDDVKRVQPVCLRFGVHINVHHGEHDLVEDGEPNAVRIDAV
jgi:hypothetical protein